MARNLKHNTSSITADYHVLLLSGHDRACWLRTHSLKPTCFTQQELVVDCANGVGAAALEELQLRLQGGMRLQLRNTDLRNTAKLNAGCGADFVQKDRACPSGVSTSEASSR